MDGYKNQEEKWVHEEKLSVSRAKFTNRQNQNMFKRSFAKKLTFEHKLEEGKGINYMGRALQGRLKIS